MINLSCALDRGKRTSNAHNKLILKQAGYPNVSNLAGGILAWSEEIDPKVPKY